MKNIHFSLMKTTHIHVCRLLIYAHEYVDNTCEIINMEYANNCSFKNWLTAWIPPFSLFYQHSTSWYRGVWVCFNFNVLKSSLESVDLRILAGAQITREVDLSKRIYFQTVSVLFFQHPLSHDITMQYYINSGNKDFLLEQACTPLVIMGF